MPENFFFDVETQFLCYRTTEDDLLRAERIFARDFSKSTKLNQRTVYEGHDKRMTGIVGELAFAHYFEGRCRYVGHADIPYDFIVVDSNGKERRVDVKTKCRNVLPQHWHEATVPVYQSTDHFRDVDMYAFLSTRKNFELVWFCGLITKSHWEKNPKRNFLKAGTTVPSNGLLTKMDTYELAYEELIQFPPV